ASSSCPVGSGCRRRRWPSSPPCPRSSSSCCSPPAGATSRSIRHMPTPSRCLVRRMRSSWQTHPTAGEPLVRLIWLDGIALKMPDSSAPQLHPLLQVTGAVKKLGAPSAVDGLDFQAYPAEIVALLGPNGAGKTTTIEM